MLSKGAPTILFVDDEVHVTAALEMAFHKRPFEVYTANSADEALGIMAGTPIDAVVSDEHMPFMTGSQFLSVVRQLYPESIRIILSGQANLAATLAAINDAQAHHFLLKPCSPDALASCLARAMDDRQNNWRERAMRSLRQELAHITEFEAALDALWMAFQPIVRAGSHDLFAYEALVRSSHAELNTPGKLFAVAEECQRVEQLEHSIHDLIGQKASHLPGDVRLMVNVDPRSLSGGDLHCETSALFPHRNRIFLEITERQKLHEIPGSSDVLSELRILGYRMALDDLGAGYAGLNSFALIHPDIVKFDMELIRNIDRSPTKANLVRSMALLCREMGVLTVAEGIETSEECAAATALGCDLLQGYYISRPSPVFA